MNDPRVSIIINNYNYAAYVARAIESALGQTYPHCEVVVVDDGSTDGSQDVIARYAGRVRAVLQENGGQASALTSGWQASRGDVLFFLDADDFFLPHKVEEMLSLLAEKSLLSGDVMACHTLAIVDAEGQETHKTIPEMLPGLDGDYPAVSALTRLCGPKEVYEFAARWGAVHFLGTPTSGLVMTRTLADKVFPLPTGVRVSADDFVVKAAALLGEIYGVGRPLACYRVHGANHWYAKPQMRSKEFIRQLDGFLNAKLKTQGKRPVFDYMGSIFARQYPLDDGDMRGLWKLAWKVPARHLTPRTGLFCLKTVCLCARMAVRKTSYRKEPALL